MFGYITIDRDELKGKELDRYRSYYCGVCMDLKGACGQRARMTLTYDMTFLAILLTDLYDDMTPAERKFCLLHPAQRQLCLQNAYTKYAADMNLLLVYHNLCDNWIDERSHRSYAAARLIRNAYLATAKRHPETVRRIRKYLKELHAVEESGSCDLDLASGLTGNLMGEIFAYAEDEWTDELRNLGFYLGKFIYLMDAWDDVKEDRARGSYNPFRALAAEPDFEERANEVLTLQAAAATRAFERLPLVENVDILRNILYSGIWTKYRRKRAENELPGKKQRR